MVFPVHHFEGIKEFKKVLFGLKTEIQALIGEETRIMLALKKSSSIWNSVVRNKQLSILNFVTSQRCDIPGCHQCPLTNDQSRLTINNELVRVPINLNCKSKNVIYVWLCKICAEAYFGRTTQESHDRTSGHRTLTLGLNRYKVWGLELLGTCVLFNSFIIVISFIFYF